MKVTGTNQEEQFSTGLDCPASHHVRQQHGWQMTRRTFIASATATGMALVSKEQQVSQAREGAIQEKVAIVAEFGTSVDYPIVKSKFAVFNSCIVPLSTYERDSAFFGVVKPESLRIDLGWGADWAGWSEQPIQGTADAPTLHLDEMDHIAEIINEHGTLPYWSYCYTPSPLQDPPGDWRSVPEDMEAWGRVLTEVVRHYRDLRDTNPVGYHEVYNEPDNDDFTVGTMQDYFNLYQAAAPAIRDADPESLIGGPALAFTKEWIDPFLDFVAEESLPFDYFSTHHYGTNDLFQGLNAMLDASRDSLDRHSQFATVEIHLNEFNSYLIDYPIDGTQQKHRLAAAFLRDMAYFLARPEVTLIHWAQFLDSGMGNFSGMISIDGHPKAVFNAADIYRRLPADRVKLTIDGPVGVGGLAGASDHRAGVAIWNLEPGKQDISLSLEDLPFAKGTIREYRIDSEHASWGDDAASETLEPISTSSLAESSHPFWHGTVAGGGVLYLEIEADGDNAGQDSAGPGRWLRTLHYYPDRTTTAYADFDKESWVFRMGTAEDAGADIKIGFMCDQVPGKILVETFIEGDPQLIDEHSLLGVRVDYDTSSGYKHSLVVHGPFRGGADIFDAAHESDMPWGTKMPHDDQLSVTDFASFTLPIEVNAPEDWTGRVQISAIMNNVGSGVRARIMLRRA
jgi:xylan 1,4-beta-xylosidase